MKEKDIQKKITKLLGEIDIELNVMADNKDMVALEKIMGLIEGTIYGSVVTSHIADVFVVRKDKNGNVVFYSDDEGYGQWKEYDKKGRVVHTYDSNGDEGWYEYNEDGLMAHFHNNDGFKIYKEYDDEKKMTYYEDSMGEVWGHKKVVE